VSGFPGGHFRLHGSEQSRAGGIAHGALRSGATQAAAQGRELFAHEIVDAGFQSGIFGGTAGFKFSIRAEVFQAHHVALHWVHFAMMVHHRRMGRLAGGLGFRFRVARLQAGVQGRLGRGAHCRSGALHHLHQQTLGAHFLVHGV